MKRLMTVLLAVAVLQTILGHPQQQLSEQSEQSDKWYVGANMGLNAKTTHTSIFNNLNASMSVRYGYDLTPTVGFMGEGTFFFGDQKFGFSSSFIKSYNLDILATFNLSNIIFKHTTMRRHYETRFFAGLGLNHICGELLTNNNNDMIAKLGFDLGMNIGKRRELFLFVQPAINYNLDRYSRTQFNLNYSALQLAVGAHYRFSLSSLFHHKSKKLSEQENIAKEIDDLMKDPVVIARMNPAVEQQKVTIVEPVAKPEPKVELKPEPKPAPKVEPKPEPKPEPKVESKPETKVEQEVTKQEKDSVASSKPSTGSKAKSGSGSKAKSTGGSNAKSGTGSKAKSTGGSKAKSGSGSRAKSTGGSKGRSGSGSKAKSTGAHTAKNTGADTSKNVADTAKNTGADTAKNTGVTSTPKNADVSQKLSEVGEYMRTHPKSKVIIRGDAAEAQNAATQLARRYGISLTRITIIEEATTGITFKVE